MRRQLDRWVKSGRLIQLRRGVYSVAPPYQADAPHPFLLANHLRKSSYVSLQSALSPKLFEAMWNEGIALGTLPLSDPREGIEVDIELARVLNCLKNSSPE